MVEIIKTIPVKFYAEESGREPVREWILGQDEETRKTIGKDIRIVQIRWPLGMPLVGSLGDGLWEIRSKLFNTIARTIFTFEHGYIVLLHGFIKKTKKTPPQDLELAKRRAKNIRGKDDKI